MGDLNSRIGQQCNYVAGDFATHIDVLPDDFIPDQVLSRKSQDNITNSNGQLLGFEWQMFESARIEMLVYSRMWVAEASALWIIVL